MLGHRTSSSAAVGSWWALSRKYLVTSPADPARVVDVLEQFAALPTPVHVNMYSLLYFDLLVPNLPMLVSLLPVLLINEEESKACTIIIIIFIYIFRLHL